MYITRCIEGYNAYIYHRVYRVVISVDILGVGI